MRRAATGPTIRPSRSLTRASGRKMRASAILIVFAPLLAFANAMAADAITASCRSAIDSEVKNWHVPVVSKDIADWAQQEHFNPVVAAGDFDGNGETDQAVLVETGGKAKIAVCFSNQHEVILRLIEQPYCSDYVAMSPARSAHYNYETDATETIERDGISAGCFEKAGATYVYDRGAFRRIVDSD
jgi:hypothetical protein